MAAVRQKLFFLTAVNFPRKLKFARFAGIYTMINSEHIINASSVGRSKYPRSNPRQLQYGTAGFREK
jgi:hypothetical protein